MTKSGKTAAKVAAGTDAEGNQLYEWVLSTDSAGNLPIGIKITGLNHYSGTQNLTMTVVTGETALGTGKENSYGFSLTFHPTADGFSDFTPTLTFGKAGEYIDLNLNAMVNDTSDTGSETATVTLKGLGDGASFFICLLYTSTSLPSLPLPEARWNSRAARARDAHGS